MEWVSEAICDARAWERGTSIDEHFAQWRVSYELDEGSALALTADYVDARGVSHETACQTEESWPPLVGGRAGGAGGCPRAPPTDGAAVPTRYHAPQPSERPAEPYLVVSGPHNVDSHRDRECSDP